MNKKHTATAILGPFVLLVAASFPQAASQANDNWPQWRGANFDNVSSETGLPVEFNQNKNLLWRFEMPGPGGASPIVWGDQIFVTTVDGDNDIRLLCIGTDGKQKWNKQLKGKNRNARDGGNSASPSPCTDGSHVWANSTAGYVECFDMDGNPVWSVDLQQRYGDFNIQFGMTSTPILHEGRLYLQLIHGNMRDRNTTSQGWVVALDASNGKQIWKHLRETDGTMENKHSYASPTIAHDGDRAFLITHGGDYVIGHSLEDGHELWRCGGLNPKGRGYNRFLRFVASPLYADGKIFVPSAKSGPVICLKAGLSGDVTEDQSARYWTLQRATPDVSTPACHDGLLFLTRENGAMLCLDANSGEQVYMERMFADRHRSSPLIADGKVYVAGRDGTVLVLSADREKTVLAENELGEETMASPAIAAGRIYIRTFDALYAFGRN